MQRNREAILEYLITLLKKLAQDYEYEGVIGPDTRLFADLGYESLDLVILGTAIQEHYRQPMAFAEFMAKLGERKIRDLSVVELVEFIEGELARGAQQWEPGNT